MRSRAAACRALAPIDTSLLTSAGWVPPAAALQGREGLRGQYWFTEAELRNGVALRPDKTGKALLTLLRHMGRVSEVWRDAGGP